MKGNQGTFLPRSWWKVTKGLFYLGTGVILTKGLFYLDLSLFKCWSKGISTLTWTIEMTIKVLLYFDPKLLKCRSKGFSTSILLLLAKSQNLGLDFKRWVLCGPTIFEMCDLHLFLLDLNFFSFLGRKLWLVFVVFLCWHPILQPAFNLTWRIKG